MNNMHHEEGPMPEARLVDGATGDGARDAASSEQESYEHAAAALGGALTTRARMPADLRERVMREGEAIVAARRHTPSAHRRPGSHRGGRLAWVAAAACLGIAVVSVAIALHAIRQREQEMEAHQAAVGALQQRVEDNESLLASARADNQALTDELARTGDEHARTLAEVRQRNVDLAARLAAVTSDFESRLAETAASLDRASAEITRLTTPLSQDQLATSRRKLLEVPDTVRIEWVPFDLSEANLAEQHGDVAGDVVWNDQRQEGYLRFTGLAVNDPRIEQYQVWLIDERGMEQKVSGGVFNASADGEIIVPIEPGIDVGRVAVFAITVEEPGGIWVPDLSRRIVVAPRSDES